jgi:hypothetical protein
MRINVTGKKTGTINILRDPKPLEDNSISLMDVLQQLGEQFPGYRCEHVNGELVSYAVGEPVLVDGKTIEDALYKLVFKDNYIEIKVGSENTYILELVKE